MDFANAVEASLAPTHQQNDVLPKICIYTQILLQDCEIADMDVQSWLYAAQVYEDLYRKRFSVGELDILIGAFCIKNGYTLVTNNTDDFKNMNGIKLVDWTKPQP